jgi:hypothetical protein
MALSSTAPEDVSALSERAPPAADARAASLDLRPWRQRWPHERWRMTFATLLALLIHALLLSLAIGGDGLGLPGLQLPWRERRVEVPDLQIVLLPAAVAVALPQAASSAPSATSAPAASLAWVESAIVTSPAPSRTEAAVPAAPTKARPAAMRLPVTPPRGPARPLADIAMPDPHAPPRVDRRSEPSRTAMPLPDTIALANPDASSWQVPVAPDPAPVAVAASPVASVPAREILARDAGDAAREGVEQLTREQGAERVELERARQAAEQQVAAQLAAEQATAARQEAERQQAALQAAARQEAAQQEASRLAAQALEAAREDAARRETLRQEAQSAEAVRQDAERQRAAQLEAARQESARQEAVRSEAARQEAALLAAARQQAAQQEVERAQAQRAEAARLDAERQQAAVKEAARQEAARLEAARMDSQRAEAARREAESLHSAQQELARQEAMRQEAAQREAELRQAAQREAELRQAAQQEADRQEAMRLEATRVEAQRAEALRKEAERRQAAQQEGARQEAARAAAQQAEAARQDAERLRAAQQAAAQSTPAPVEGANDAAERREARLRAIGRQLDEEAARRNAALAATPPSTMRSPSSSGIRRGRLFGRSDANAELVLYAEAWSRKIQLNMTFDMVREALRQPYTNPLVTVAIRSDGSVESVTFVLTSGVPAIDEAIRRIVQSQAPYQAFSPALAREFDVVEIRRAWYFDTAIRLY